MRPEGDAATHPDGRGFVAGARAPRSFLTPWLGSAQIDIGLCLGAGCAPAAIRTQGDNGIMNGLASLLGIRDQLNLGFPGLFSSENSRAHGLSLFRFGGFLFCGTHDDVGALGAGHGAADQNHSIIFADLDNLQILDGDALVSHMAGHSHVFPNPARRGTISDCAVSAMHHRPVTGWLTVEIVLLHDALKALALGLADHIHKLADFEHRESDVGALGRRFTPGKAKLANEFFGGRSGLCEMTGLRLADTLGLLISKADLYRTVAILIRVFDLKDAISPRLR